MYSTLDQRHVELYSDSDVLPGIDQCVVHDTTWDAKQTFDDEMTGFSDHLALQVRQDNECPILFLEKLGISDHESVLLHGQSFIASALCNLVDKPLILLFIGLHVMSESMVILVFSQICVRHYIHMELEVLRIQHTLSPSHFRSKQIIILILQTAHFNIITHSSLLF